MESHLKKFGKKEWGIENAIRLQESVFYQIYSLNFPHSFNIF
jgi:hypothetical protein